MSEREWELSECQRENGSSLCENGSGLSVNGSSLSVWVRLPVCRSEISLDVTLRE